MPFIGSILTAIFQLFLSRPGQLILAFSVAWTWSWWRTDAHWRSVIAAEKAEIELRYQVEIARQAEAAREIAEAATTRVSEELELNADLKAKIERYANAEKKFHDAGCFIDDDFAGVVQKLSPGLRAAKPAAGSGKLRKAR